MTENQGLLLLAKIGIFADCHPFTDGAAAMLLATPCGDDTSAPFGPIAR